MPEPWEISETDFMASHNQADEALHSPQAGERALTYY